MEKQASAAAARAAITNAALAKSSVTVFGIVGAGLQSVMYADRTRGRALPSKSITLSWRRVVLAAGAATVSSAAIADDSWLQYIQFYGVIDAGVSYQTHGNPFNNHLPTNVNAFLTKYNDNSNLSVASNGMSFSTVGAKGNVPVNADLSGVFQLETSFNPASGSLPNGPESLAGNNGTDPSKYTSFGDSNKAGQLFNGNAYVGLDSKTYGRLTLGRHSSLMNDNVCRYDALTCAPALSYVGYFGAPAGLGDTEDRVMDSTVKYTINFGSMRAGAFYQFPRMPSSSGGDTRGHAFQFSLGVTQGPLSIDAVYGEREDGIFLVSPLSAAQVAALSNPASPTFGLPVSKTLNAIVSDNEAYGLFAKYDLDKLKLFLGYEHVRQANPDSPLANGTQTIGGYRIIANNTAFPKPKVVQYFWAGAKYSINDHWDLAGSWYHARQDSYETTSCSDDRSGRCSGQYNTLSFVASYKFLEGMMKGIDVYGGVAHTSATDGMASGFINQDNTSTMMGARYTF